jgi:hypothetical protein
VNKEEIDLYFQTNWNEIQSVVKVNSSKCATINVSDITTEIYLTCINRAAKIPNERSLGGFIRMVSSNTYKWNNSEFNINNKILANELLNDNIYMEDDEVNDSHYQNRLYAIEMYRLNAEPHELRFLDIYLVKKITTVRGLVKHLNISHHGAYTIIKDFKRKLKEYERQAEIS